MCVKMISLQRVVWYVRDIMKALDKRVDSDHSRFHWSWRKLKNKSDRVLCEHLKKLLNNAQRRTVRHLETVIKKNALAYKVLRDVYDEQPRFGKQQRQQHQQRQHQARRQQHQQNDDLFERLEQRAKDIDEG